jgi:4-phytase/acid phosphatase
VRKASQRFFSAKKQQKTLYLWAGFCASIACVAPAQAAPALKLERTVLLIRHGVRPPTHEPALSPAIAPDPWPHWDTPDGDLTPHGAAAISLLAAYDRKIFVPAPGCPDINVYADVDERTVNTGEAYAAGFAPGCNITVRHAPGATDPLFSALDNGAPNFDAKLAKTQMLAAAGGSLTATIAAHQALFTAMQATLQPGGDAFLTLPARVSAKRPHMKPTLTGPIAEGASGAEDFLLEYLDDKPMSQVAWGRASPTQIATLLALHPLAYTITARPPAIARATASPLLQKILGDLTAGPATSILIGHDTNQAELGGLLNLHWQLGGYPADDPPPGGGIIFSLLAAPNGTQYVTATYQTQTMAQIRNLTPLNATNPPATQPLPIPGCGNSPSPTACTLAAFAALVRGVTG